MAKDIYKKDLYAIIGVSEEASEKEILKGYRKKALKCHPDKNPDNPKAAELFHELSSALEILTDTAARAAYDQLLKAKKATAARNKVLDSKRKKFKEDLEAREKAAFERSETAKAETAGKKLQAEIERLRKEGSRLLEQEQERMREELRQTVPQGEGEEAKGKSTDGSEPVRIKLKWKAQKNDNSNGGYNSDNLRAILSCYGVINTLIVSSKRNGSAIVEYETSGVSCDILEESGLKENPFSIVWLSGKPMERNDNHSTEEEDGIFNSRVNFTVQSDGYASVNYGGQNNTQGPSVNSANNSGKGDGRDFENIVLMKMRQAEERKKLIEQMMKEDEDAG